MNYDLMVKNFLKQKVTYADLFCFTFKISEEELFRMIEEHEDLKLEIVKAYFFGLENTVPELIEKYRKEVEK